MNRYATALADVLVEIRGESSLERGCRAEINRLEGTRSGLGWRAAPFRWEHLRSNVAPPRIH